MQNSSSDSANSIGKSTAKVIEMPRLADDINRDRIRGALARLPAALHSLREKNLQLMQPLLRSLFEQVDDSLFQLADNATNNQEQNLYFDAMREVRIARRDIGKRFGEGLDSAFVQLLQSATSDGPEAVSLDELSLVPSDEIEELVAVDAMVAKALAVCAEPLGHLSMRLDNQLSVKVYPGNNPFSPRVLCQSFTAPVKALNIDIKAKLMIFKLFDRVVISQLLAVYAQLNQFLIDQNILPSLQQDLKTSQKTVAAVPSRNSPLEGTAAVGSASNNGISGHAGRVNSDVLESLRGLMAQGRENTPAGDIGTGAGDVAGSASQGELLAVLSQLQSTQIQQSASSLQSGQRHAANASVAPLNLQQMAQQMLLGQQRGSIGSAESDVIKLVNMLFEFILDDRNLAAPMKVLLARLQIPILKLALSDSSFFGRGGHPARRLVNEMSNAALGWQEAIADDTGSIEAKRSDRLYEKVDSTVARILSDYDDDPQLFNELLTDFISFTQKEQRRAKLLEQRTIDAEDGKARSELARNLVVDALCDLIGAEILPEVGEQLIHQAWSNVLLMVALKHGENSEQWQAHLSTASDLIWSLVAPMTKENRYKLLKLAPVLLKRLRLGLEEISFNRYETAHLFKTLEATHIARLRAAMAAPEIKVSEAVSSDGGIQPVTPVDESVSEGSADSAAAHFDAVNAPLETESLPVNSEDVKAEASASNTAEASVEDAWLQQVDRLARGSWFEVVGADGVDFRCRLAAIIRPAGKYIFVNRAGIKVAERDRNSLAKALKNNELRILDDGMLFDRALENVIGDLRKSRS